MLVSIIENNNGVPLPCNCNNETLISRVKTNNAHLCHYQTNLIDLISLFLMGQLATRHTENV